MRVVKISGNFDQSNYKLKNNSKEVSFGNLKYLVAGSIFAIAISSSALSQSRNINQKDKFVKEAQSSSTSVKPVVLATKSTIDVKRLADSVTNIINLNLKKRMPNCATPLKGYKKLDNVINQIYKKACESAAETGGLIWPPQITIDRELSKNEDVAISQIRNTINDVKKRNGTLIPCIDGYVYSIDNSKINKDALSFINNYINKTKNNSMLSIKSYLTNTLIPKMSQQDKYYKINVPIDFQTTFLDAPMGKYIGRLGVKIKK